MLNALKLVIHLNGSYVYAPPLPTTETIFSKPWGTAGNTALYIRQLLRVDFTTDTCIKSLRCTS